MSENDVNHFSNRWIKKATKEKLDKVQLPPLPQPRARQTSPSLREIEMQNFANTLRRQLNDFVSHRSLAAASLTKSELATVADYLSQPCSKELTDELLILGIRYPDKNLNNLCEDFIIKNRMHAVYPDYRFWIKIWKDDNLVPNNAIRLMFKDGKINPSFGRHMIGMLLPLIQIQRDKEIARLKSAQLFKRPTARRTERLELFNQLISAAEQYVI